MTDLWFSLRLQGCFGGETSSDDSEAPPVFKVLGKGWGTGSSLQ